MNLLPAITSGKPLLDTIHHCKAETLLTALPDGAIDLIVTSPPYDNLRTYNGFAWDFELIASHSYRVLKPGGVLVWVVGDATVNGSETLTSMRQAIHFVDCVGFRMHDTMIYQKDSMPFPETVRYQQVFEYMFVLTKGKPRVFNAIMQRNKNAGRVLDATHRETGENTFKNTGIIIRLEKPLSNIWEVSTGYMRTTTDKDAYQHPAMFPEKLAERHILSWSNPGDVVLDYFAGSGTTLKMARLNGRHFLGCDISGEYVALAKQRLSQPYTLPMFAGVTA